MTRDTTDAIVTYVGNTLQLETINVTATDEEFWKKGIQTGWSREEAQS